MKKYISTILSLVILLGSMQTAIAAEAPTRGKKVPLMTDYEVMLRQFPEEEAKLLDSGLVIPVPQVRGVQSIYGIYTSLSLPAIALSIVMNSVGNNSSYSQVTYNNVACFKFEYNSDTVYIARTAFETERGVTTYPSTATVSSNITSMLNNDDSNFYFTGISRNFFAGGYYNIKLQLIGVRAYYFNNDNIYMTTNITDSCYFFGKGSELQAVKGSDSFMAKVQPTMALNMTNAGTGKRYMGGFDFSGKGQDTSTNSLGDLIKLGYSTTQLVGTIGTLSISSIYSLYNYLVTLQKSGGWFEPKTYIAESTPLSNVSQGKYGYTCNLQVPYNLISNGNYCEMQIGLRGVNSTAVRFSTNITFLYTYENA